MSKIILYVTLMSLLYAQLDFTVIKLTRVDQPQLASKMHNMEFTYSIIVYTAEVILCAPAMIFKPLLFHSLIRVEASEEEQKQIQHAPPATLRGFYQLPNRSHSWTLVPWLWHIIYWIPWSIVWFFGLYEFHSRRILWQLQQQG
jgi:hypothetical protein